MKAAGRAITPESPAAQHRHGSARREEEEDFESLIVEPPPVPTTTTPKLFLYSAFVAGRHPNCEVTAGCFVLRLQVWTNI